MLLLRTAAGAVCLWCFPALVGGSSGVQTAEGESLSPAIAVQEVHKGPGPGKAPESDGSAPGAPPGPTASLLLLVAAAEGAGREADLVVSRWEFRMTD